MHVSKDFDHNQCFNNLIEAPTMPVYSKLMLDFDLSCSLQLIILPIAEGLAFCNQDSASAFEFLERLDHEWRE